MKKCLFIFFAFIVLALNSSAQVILTSFQIRPDYVTNNLVNVSNINAPTAFKFAYQLHRGVLSTGGFRSGICNISVLYTEAQSGDSSIGSDPSTIVLYSKNVTSSDYNNESATFIDMDASLPANKSGGKILLRYVYLDESNQVTIVNYSTTRYGINVVITPTEILYPFPSNYSARQFNYTSSNNAATYTSIQMNNQSPILQSGQSLYSPNNLYRLYLQTDGNLVLYKKNGDGSETGIWNTQTNGRPAGNLYFQTDGNLVIYGVNNSPSNPAPGIWASNINNTSGSSAGYNDVAVNSRPYLALQNDGNLVIYWPAYRNDTRTKVNVIFAATDTAGGATSTHSGNLNSFVNSDSHAGNFYVSHF